MPHGNLPVERCERQREGGGRVAVHEHGIGRRPLQHGAGSREDAPGELVERLRRAHDVEVVIDVQVEQVHHLIEHLAVLRGCQHLHVERLVASSARSTGAILTASGRVPNATITLVLLAMRASFRPSGIVA